MPTSVRLEPKTENLLRRLAKLRRQTNSEVIRDTLRTLANTEQVEDPPPPYEALELFLGWAGAGPRDLSKRTSEKFHKRLLERKPKLFANLQS